MGRHVNELGQATVDFQECGNNKLYFILVEIQKITLEVDCCRNGCLFHQLNEHCLRNLLNLVACKTQ